MFILPSGCQKSSIQRKRRNCNFLRGIFFTSLFFLSISSALADVPGAPVLEPISLPAAPPQFIPTDVTPFTVSPQRNSFTPGYKFKIFQILPERLWFNLTTEVSQRLDTNVLFTYSKPKADYAFRALPNISVGYNILKNTSIYCNYFVIKDIFARDYNSISFPTTQSLSWGIQHNQQLGRKTTLQYTFQARELWQASHLHQFDFLPGVTLTRVVTPRNIFWFSTLLQLRGKDYFVAPTREIDPFYTIGYMHQRGMWTLVINDTLVTNFRHPPFNDAIPPQSNMSMITDIEINHPVSKKFPSLLAFVRAEPIWNWDSHKAPGISGFDFRLYGGLRLSINKPSYYAAMDDMHKQLMEAEPKAKTPSTSETPDKESSAIPENEIMPVSSVEPELHPALSVPATPDKESNAANKNEIAPVNSTELQLRPPLSVAKPWQTTDTAQLTETN